jgi:hypothetical protein
MSDLNQQAKPEKNEATEAEPLLSDEQFAADNPSLLRALRLVDQLFGNAKMVDAPPHFAEKVIIAVSQMQLTSPLVRWLRRYIKFPHP